MSRVKLRKGRQSIFLSRVGEYFGFDWDKIAKISRISERTLRDWRREKYNMSYESMLKLHNSSKISTPNGANILPEFWSAKKYARQGGFKRYELYGNFGNIEGRRKGGLISQRLFRLNPEYARSIGVIVRKPVKEPELSEKLAELIGIMLGDGGMTDYQINVTFNSKTEKEYGTYIRNLIEELFAINVSIIHTESVNADRIIASGKNLVEFLKRKGLKTGNKVINQVGIPKWIGLKNEYKISCLRGLMDTDGSFYSYLHRVSNKMYRNYALDFTNHSIPLLQGVKNILQNFGCIPSLAKYKVVLHKKNDIKRYMLTVGSSNPRTKEKIRNSKILL